MIIELLAGSRREPASSYHAFMDDPFLTLLVEALNIMHPRFAAANPVHEFYHQFRRLWDKALPVQLGLGHLVIHPGPFPQHCTKPDFLVWQLEPERPLAAINFGSTDPLHPCRTLEYPLLVCIGYGSVPPEEHGVSRIHFDTTRRVATILE